MKLPLVGIVLLAAAAASQAAEDLRPQVLVTAFGPFDGRGVNGSATLARRLEGTEIGGAVVRIAVLPVVWGEPKAQLPKLVAEIKPVLLLGLGEGYPGRIVIERKGHNVADGPDISGHPPTAAKLESEGPAERPFRLALDGAWFADSPLPVSASDDAGAYLCNCLLYTALAQPVAKTGFVHLPPQGAVADDAYCTACMPAVKALIAHNLAR